MQKAHVHAPSNTKRNQTSLWNFGLDRGRALTPLQHHVEDHERRVGLEDRTHWREFIEVSVPAFNHRWVREARLPDVSYDFDYVVGHGHLHYHVWTQTEIVDLLRYAGCRILFVMDRPLDRDDSFCVIAEKPGTAL